MNEEALKRREEFYRTIFALALRKRYQMNSSLTNEQILKGFEGSSCLGQIQAEINMAFIRFKVFSVGLKLLAGFGAIVSAVRKATGYETR